MIVFINFQAIEIVENWSALWNTKAVIQWLFRANINVPTGDVPLSAISISYPASGADVPSTTQVNYSHYVCLLESIKIKYTNEGLKFYFKLIFQSPGWKSDFSCSWYLCFSVVWNYNGIIDWWEREVLILSFLVIYCVMKVGMIMPESKSHLCTMSCICSNSFKIYYRAFIPWIPEVLTIVRVFSTSRARRYANEKIRDWLFNKKLKLNK